jgi:hypothetical protein
VAICCLYSISAISTSARMAAPVCYRMPGVHAPPDLPDTVIALGPSRQCLEADATMALAAAVVAAWQPPYGQTG